MNRFKKIMGYIIMAILVSLSAPAHAEDGYDLWLRARAVAGAEPVVTRLGDTPTLRLAEAELRRDLPRQDRPTVVGTQADPSIAALGLKLKSLGEEGYSVQAATVGGRQVLLVAGNTDRGALYGAFALARHVAVNGSSGDVSLRSVPRIKLRMLNHWDNLDGTVERGYAGQSLWDWWKLPDFRDPRYTDYARANASIGINGTVLNNVNAKADSLTAPYLAKAAALADVFRPWGIRVYLSVRFSAPIEIGGLKTADPRDPAVAAWWRGKADEIYRIIPDFGGFLVKANSEGQPGPRDYGATHAAGANMLAAALRPHGGIVIWRAFVYADTNADDRAKQAYSEFKPIDGRFANNVLVQVKNGPIDFQPREPFHPLFGAMPKTPLMAEFQITKEYLGFATHLAYLGPLFTETLQARTGRGGETVADVISGEAEHHALSGIAGVANIGRDRDWSGSTFNQANWYAFGRLAWDPNLSSDTIAREWVAQTFGTDPEVISTVTAMMAGSREAVVDYTGAFGLAHLMATGHHYGPGPWVKDLARPEWNPVYYHRADRNGIGFDRTRTGSNAVAQYAPAIARSFADLKATPENFLLWFHHVSWDHPMADGRSLWADLVAHYDRGVAYVGRMQGDWQTLRPKIDADRWQKTAAFLAVQHREATWWRDASLTYWMSINGRALPSGVPQPAHDLAWYQAQSFPYAPGHTP
jgi:alpha-glucuronidase